MKAYGIQKRYKRSYSRYRYPHFINWCNFKMYQTKERRDERLQELQQEDSHFEYRAIGGMLH